MSYVTDHSLRALALRTLLASAPGHTAPDWARRLLADGLGGIVLFGYNVDSPAQLAGLVGQLRDARDGAVVAIDEEGGDVTRLAHRTGSPYPGNAALGAVDDRGLTRDGVRARSAPTWPRSASTSTWRRPST